MTCSLAVMPFSKSCSRTERGFGGATAASSLGDGSCSSCAGEVTECRGDGSLSELRSPLLPIEGGNAGLVTCDEEVVTMRREDVFGLQHHDALGGVGTRDELRRVGLAASTWPAFRSFTAMYCGNMMIG